MKFYKAVIFDLDGTLLNTLEDLADSVNKVLKNRNLDTHPVERYKYLVGDGIEMLAKRALPETLQTEQHIKEFVNDIREEYSKIWKNKTTVYDGIPDLLDELNQKEIKLSILSNKPDNFTKLVVAEFLDKWKFEIIQGALDDIPKKPDPILANKIADKLGINNENIIFVGDTSVDMKTATAAGMYPIGVTWGFRDEKELLENGAEKIIHFPLQLLEYI